MSTYTPATANYLVRSYVDSMVPSTAKMSPNDAVKQYRLYAAFAHSADYLDYTGYEHLDYLATSFINDKCDSYEKVFGEDGNVRYTPYRHCQAGPSYQVPFSARSLALDVIRTYSAVDEVHS